VLSAGPGDSVYVVKILHAYADSNGRRVTAAALQRLYAVKAASAPYGWQLSNGFSQISRNWVRRTEGRITFHYVPGQNPDPGRIRLASQFIDSVATLFAVSPPERLDYIVAASPDDYARAIGLDYLHVPSGPGSDVGGQVSTGQGIVYAGGQGEVYLHELTHAVLARYLGGGVFLNEGVPTWFGGSKGRPFPVMCRLLADYQRAHPEITIEEFIRGRDEDDPHVHDAVQATGALFVDHVYRRRGVPGLRALKGSPVGASELLQFMRQHLGLPLTDPGALDAWWRQAARESNG
jgi:hypothetical protein